MKCGEYLAWCKQWAPEYVAVGELTNAAASTSSDMNKHPLRNTGLGAIRLDLLQDKSQRPRPSLKVVQDAPLVAIFIVGRAGIDIRHAVTKGIVKQNSDLARGGGDRFAFPTHAPIAGGRKYPAQYRFAQPRWQLAATRRRPDCARAASSTTVPSPRISEYLVVRCQPQPRGEVPRARPGCQVGADQLQRQGWTQAVDQGQVHPEDRMKCLAYAVG